MKPEEFKKLLEKYESGTCTDQERELIEQWYSEINIPARVVRDESIEKNLWSKVKPAEGQRGGNGINFFLRVAAAVTLLVAAFLVVINVKWPGVAETSSFASKEGFINIENKSEALKEVTLEDGSIVTLKPKSKIAFSKQFVADKREVFLEGEAFFNVSKDKNRPFIVYSKEVVTKVLGTSFNIRAYDTDEQITVAVKTGKVSVFTKVSEAATELSAHEGVVLRPNYQLVYDREKERVKKELVSIPAIVLEEPTLFNMKFDGAPVSTIFHALEENYGVEIQYDEALLKNCVLTTSMSNEGLYERIEIICKAINATYVIEDAVIHINGRGC
ncbi:FecR family protein [Chryseosolibacter indicus]|uniref:FecR domain-containing protein n=1 Tax=Chryseosolibacter indicus TaxID=2782351 RepID=A0ABS5VUW1_9BACT|nr:FecR family protein [Chryseosolibacter indicus]MBT1705213.1 FecR domain-containing protein [Chryseosolibacter indicus]